MEPGTEAENADAGAEPGARGPADPTGAGGVDAEGGRVAVEEAPAKAEPGEGPVPVPPPPEPTPQPVPQPMSWPADESAVAAAAGAEEEITITDQDVLFGRGGLTNRHIGNLRYRDIISIHRQDYVRSSKVDKPKVARRIVMAIRTGKNPGRFLRKGDDGRWVAVSDKEAAWKASQALREKSRWRSMREEAALSRIRHVQMTTGPNNPAAERRRAKALERKRRIKEEPKGIYATGPEMNKGRFELKISSLIGVPALSQLPEEKMPTEVSQISVPPVAQVGPTYMLESSHISPRDEDVLFGRGGRTNHHPGNRRLREIVDRYRDAYTRAKKVDKPKVSKLIVVALRSADPPSRFLRMDRDTALWEDVGDRRAAEKVSQTLREKDKGAGRSAPAARENEAFPAAPPAPSRLAAELARDYARHGKVDSPFAREDEAFLAWKRAAAERATDVTENPTAEAILAAADASPVAREATADPTSAVLSAAQAAEEQAADVTGNPAAEVMAAEAAPAADEENSSFFVTV